MNRCGPRGYSGARSFRSARICATVGRLPRIGMRASRRRARRRRWRAGRRNSGRRCLALGSKPTGQHARTQLAQRPQRRSAFPNQTGLRRSTPTRPLGQGSAAVAAYLERGGLTYLKAHGVLMARHKRRRDNAMLSGWRFPPAADRLPRSSAAVERRIDPACMHAGTQALRGFRIDITLPHDAAERRLDMPARAAEPVVEVEMAESGVEIVAPKQVDRPGGRARRIPDCRPDR